MNSALQSDSYRPHHNYLGERVDSIGGNPIPSNSIDFDNGTHSQFDSTAYMQYDTPDQNTAAYLASLVSAGISPTTTQINAISTLVVGLKASGLWSKLYAFYPFIGGTAAAHAINAFDVGANDITWNGTLTHNANGVTGDGSTGYGDTGLNPASVLATVNGLSLGVYTNPAGTNNNGIDIGAYSNGNTLFLAAGGVATMTTAHNTAQGLKGSGLTIGTADSTEVDKVYVAGSLLNNGPLGYGLIFPSLNFYILACNQFISSPGTGSSPQSFSNRNLRLAFISQLLSPSDVANMTTLVQIFQTSLSRNL